MKNLNRLQETKSNATPSSLCEELSLRLAEWHDRLTFYNDIEAASLSRVRDNLETLIQITDELSEVLEPAYVSFLAHRLATANEHLKNVCLNYSDEHLNSAREFINFIHLKD